MSYITPLFLSDTGKPGVRSLGPDVRTRPFADLTDMTLADEDTNSIITDNANRAIQGNVDATWWQSWETKQVAPSSGQIGNQCKW